MQFSSQYQQHELQEVTPRQIQVAESFVQLMRASFFEGGVVKLSTKQAKRLRTSWKTLKNAFPEAWYCYDDSGSLCVDIPAALCFEFSSTTLG